MFSQRLCKFRLLRNRKFPQLRLSKPVLCIGIEFTIKNKISRSHTTFTAFDNNLFRVLEKLVKGTHAFITVGKGVIEKVPHRINNVGFVSLYFYRN
jgi:hypothetical protein